VIRQTAALVNHQAQQGFFSARYASAPIYSAAQLVFFVRMAVAELVYMLLDCS
jgi:hypothetical protein